MKTPAMKTLSNQITNQQIHQLIHDIATPLSSLNGFISEIYNEKQLPDARALENIKATIAQLNRIINSSQELISGETSKQEFALDLLLEHTLASLQYAFIKHKIKLIKKTTPSIALGNEVNLQRAITNILVNSLEALENRSVNRQIWVSLTSSDLSNHLNIRDNGCGIPAGNLQNIYKRGFSTKPKHAGLGLHFTKKVIEEFGGSIAITIGPTTDVEITLPKVIP